MYLIDLLIKVSQLNGIRQRILNIIEGSIVFISIVFELIPKTINRYSLTDNGLCFILFVFE